MVASKKKLVNPKLFKIEESVTIRIADKIREIENTGRRVIKLQTGDPDFATPNIIVKAAQQAMEAGYTHYSASRGLPELREAIAHKLKVENKIQYNPQNEILVTHGGIHAVFIALTSLIKEGDEVLIIDPCWMPYVSSTIIAGGIPVRIATDPQNGFKIQIRDFADRITSRTRLLIINSPSNPVGVVYTIDELQQITRLVEKYNLIVIADEVYEKLIYDDHKHISFASLPGMKERTITINSFSKTYAMTGWRLGYLAAPDELCKQILKISQYSITNIASFIQKAGIIALNDPRIFNFVSEMKETYAKRREFVMRALSSIDGIKFVKPSGAFYFMVDISSFSNNSIAFANKLLEDMLVGVVPGVSFGKSGEGFIRITFAASDKDLAEGIKRIKSFVKARG